MTNWHNKHISTQWGVAIVGFLLITVALLIPLLGQNQDVRSRAYLETPGGNPPIKCTVYLNGSYKKGICQDISKPCNGHYYQHYCPGKTTIQCCAQ